MTQSFQQTQAMDAYLIGVSVILILVIFFHVFLRMIIKRLTHRAFILSKFLSVLPWITLVFSVLILLKGIFFLVAVKKAGLILVPTGVSKYLYYSFLTKPKLLMWWLTFANIFVSLTTRVRIKEARTLLYLNQEYGTDLDFNDFT